MWIAKEAGFFKKQGLDVRLVFIASGPLGTTAILSGEVDVGVIGGFAPIRAIAGGAKNLVMIGQTKNRMTGAIVGKKEIATVQDLKGRRLGIDRIGSNPDMFSQAALSRFQIDPLKDLNYIQLGTIGQGVPALKAGTVDAITLRPPRSFRPAIRLQGDPRYHGDEDSFRGDRAPLRARYGGAQTTGVDKVHARLCRGDALFSDQRGRHKSDCC
jgi:hypothetical protein